MVAAFMFSSKKKKSNEMEKTAKWFLFSTHNKRPFQITSWSGLELPGRAELWEIGCFFFLAQIHGNDRQ